MSNKLKYFKAFLENPAAFPNREFYTKLRKWAKYVTEHQDEFNYLKDDEWKEIRERVLEELDRREDMREEFEEFSERLETGEKLETAEQIKLNREWLAFIRRNMFYFEFQEEQLLEMEAGLAKLIRCMEESRIARENLLVSKIEKEIACNGLDDALNEYYERTGKIPVLTALKKRKSFNGN